VLERVVSQRVPRSVAKTVSNLRDTVRRAVDAVRKALSEDERPLVERRVVDGAEGQLMHRVDRLERRVLAAAKRRETQLVEQVDAVHAALHPLGRPQERVLNFIPILAREGPPLLDAMRDAAATHAASLVQPTETAADASDHRSAPITT
jgi:bacillithiol synthase